MKKSLKKALKELDKIVRYCPICRKRAKVIDHLDTCECKACDYAWVSVVS